MKATWAMPARVKEEPMSREVETEQEIRLELRARPAPIALAAIAQGRRARGGLAAGRGRTSPRAAIGPKGARAVTKLEERLSTPIDGPQEASWQPNQQGNQQLSAKKRPCRRPPKPQSGLQKPPRQGPPRPPQQLQQKRRRHHRCELFGDNYESIRTLAMHLLMRPSSRKFALLK
jgi:hypothetical protein